MPVFPAFNYNIANGSTPDADQLMSNLNQLKDFLNITKLDSSNIQALGIITSLINDLAVTTGKIAALAVTTAKLNDAAVTTAKIADANVTAQKLSLTTLSDVLATTDTSIPNAWKDECSVTPAANATYLILGQATFLKTTTGGSTTNANVRLYADSAAIQTVDEYVIGTEGGAQTIPLMRFYTTTTTNPIKLQVQREGAASVNLEGNQTTWLRAIRIG